MRIAASGASPLLAMTVEMSWVKNIGHSEGEARGNPFLFAFPYYLLPLPPCSLRAANGRPYTMPLFNVAQVCHTTTGRKANITPGHGPGISLRSNITPPQGGISLKIPPLEKCRCFRYTVL